MAEKNRPINLREGTLNLAIFKNATEKGYAYSSKLTRSYQDKEGQWQETPHLRSQDHLPASNLFRRGHETIRQDRENDRAMQRSQDQAKTQRQERGPEGPAR